MKSYFVESGPLKITIVAPTAYEAAVEAVQWWGMGRSEQQAQADHRRSLSELIEVRPSPKSRLAKRFATFNLLAQADGESAAAAWERLLQEKIGLN